MNVNKIQKVFDGIEGDFNFPCIYNDMIQRFPSGSAFVEIGAYKGKSLFYLIMESYKQGKNFNITSIDNFMGVVGYTDDNLMDTFLKNTEVIYDEFTLIVGTSWEVANRFPNASVDFVFIDGAHDYHSVKKDITAWLLKVVDGGVIAGHDYHSVYNPDVIRAVHDVFGTDINTSYLHEYCWMHEVNT